MGRFLLLLAAIVGLMFGGVACKQESGEGKKDQKQPAAKKDGGEKKDNQKQNGGEKK